MDEIMPGFGAETIKLMRELLLKESDGANQSPRHDEHEHDDTLQYLNHEPVDAQFNAQKRQAELANIEEKHQLKLVLEHFKRESDVLKEEAFNTEKSLSRGMTDEDRIRIGLNLELKLSELAKSANPYNRMLAASMGACPEILSNDPVSYVRLETLKKTGHYSENYRARENSYVVIKEYIRQNIHVDYFASINEQISSLVELQKSANKIIYAIEKGNKDSYYAFLDKVNTHPELKDSFQEAQMHMDILTQSFDAPFDKQTQS